MTDKNTQIAIVRDDLSSMGRLVVELPSGLFVVGKNKEELLAQAQQLGFEDIPGVMKSRLHLNKIPRHHKNTWGEDKFVEQAQKVTFGREAVSDDDIIAALRHSADTFGTPLTLTSDCEIFSKRMARLATDLGYEISNPELQEYIGNLRPPKTATVVAFPGRCRDDSVVE